MSQATDLIASVKERLAEVETEVLAFEKNAESEVGHWTDLAQLRIADTRLSMLRDTLRHRAADTAPPDEAEEVVQGVPETHMSAGAKTGRKRSAKTEA